MGSLGRRVCRRGTASSRGADGQEPWLEAGRGQLVMRPSTGRLRMGHREPGKSVSTSVAQPVRQRQPRAGGMPTAWGWKAEGSPPGRQFVGCLAGLRG